LEVVRQGLVMHTFGNASGIDRQQGLVVIKPSGVPYEEMTPEEVSGDGEVTFAIESLDLVEGTYKVDVAAHKRDGYPYDYHRLLYTFRVKSRTHDVGIYRPHHRWSFSAGIRFKPDAP